MLLALTAHDGDTRGIATSAGDCRPYARMERTALAKEARQIVCRRKGGQHPEMHHSAGMAGGGVYNDPRSAYNGGVASNAHVMTVSQNGQVSIPAEARARWKARKVVVVDLGDRIVVRPLGDQPVDDLQGKYRGRGQSTDRARKQARQEDATRSRSR